MIFICNSRFLGLLGPIKTGTLLGTLCWHGRRRVGLLGSRVTPGGSQETGLCSAAAPLLGNSNSAEDCRLLSRLSSVCSCVPGRCSGSRPVRRPWGLLQPGAAQSRAGALALESFGVSRHGEALGTPFQQGGA